MRKAAAPASGPHPSPIRWILCLPLLGSVACLAPKYERPDYHPPSAWRTPSAESTQGADIAWWERFGDPVLTELILLALREGTDARIATARVEQSLGQYAQIRSSFFPNLGYGADAGRARTGGAGPGAAPAPGFEVYNTYQAYLSASWQLDLFGRIRNQSRAARNRLLATQEAQRGAILSLVSQVASGYILLRGHDRQLEVAVRTAAAQKESLRIFTLQYEAGVISELQINQAKSQYERAAATVPEMERLVAASENNLNILLGRNPGPIPRGKALMDIAIPPLPGVLPSSLLDRRPDVRQAEFALVATHFDIGAARAAFFPSLSLTGLVGGLSATSGSLFKSPAYTWSGSASISGPLYTGGAVSGALQSAKGAQKEALASYQKTVQAAFADADSAITAVHKYKAQIEAKRRQVQALEGYARLARISYEAGQSPYLEVLTADQNLFDAELAFAQAQGTLAQSIVNTYAAIGGGWVDLALQESRPKASPKPEGGKSGANP